jgi:hypothetical protein
MLSQSALVVREQARNNAKSGDQSPGVGDQDILVLRDLHDAVLDSENQCL